ncbi:lysine--tRNA ligase [bacterium]|nr:lysine--tRNA ligase [bacterium]MBT3730163.1 lysine--tRNA ligase [bacterium]
MFWGDAIVDKIEKNLKDRIESGKPLIIRDEKTASGRIHIGSMRGVAVHGTISEILTERGIKNKFLYEINDFDPMDGLPVYLDEKEYGKYMGQPLYTIPSPDGKAKNFAEYFAAEFMEVIEKSGFTPEYYRASELYKSGKMNDAIATTLSHAQEIREIYKKISGSVKPDDWLPLSVVCENCGKIGTTKTISFDGKEVEYVCDPEYVKWAKGCGHKGRVSPFDGNAKLPWKVEWPAKFKVLEVDIEGSGKDHSTKGGSRDIANHISKEILGYKPPFDIPYEFFLIGGKKMSSSKGEGSSAKEISDLLPPELFRLALIGKNYKQAINFEPDGDTIPILYDTYDRIADMYFDKTNDDNARLFSLIHLPNEREGIKKRYFSRFSLMSFLVQMPHMDIENEVENMKGESLTDDDKKEISSRAKYSKNWLEIYAPEKYKYELQKDNVPEQALGFSDKQKKGLREIFEYVKTQKKLDGLELHTKIHEIRKESFEDPKELFSAIYISFLGKDSGPKIGWFLSVLDKDFIEKRLEEVAK